MENSIFRRISVAFDVCYVFVCFRKYLLYDLANGKAESAKTKSNRYVLRFPSDFVYMCFGFGYVRLKNSIQTSQKN